MRPDARSDGPLADRGVVETIPSDEGKDRVRVRAFVTLVAIGFALLPFGHERLVADNPVGSRNDLRVFVFPFDIALGLAALAAVPDAVRLVRSRATGAALGCLAMLVGVTAAAAAITPSPQAFQQVLRLAGSALVAVGLATRTTRSWRPLVVTLAVVGSIETVVAVAQVVRGEALGLRILGEYQDPLFEVGADVAVRGTLLHQYFLAGLAVVFATVILMAAPRVRGVPRALTLAAGGVVAIPVGVTYSRAVAIGLAIAVVLLVLAPGRDRQLRIAGAAALVAGVALTGVVWHDGWVTRAGEASALADANDFGNDRIERAREALELVERHPFAGAGPGRYVFAVQHEIDRDPDLSLGPVHNFVLLAAGETGAFGGVAALGFLLALALRAKGGGPWILAVLASYLPLVLLDHFPYTSPHGLALLALWVGAIECGVRSERSRRRQALT